MASSTTDGKPLSGADVRRSLNLFDIGNGKKVPELALKQMLPDIETALFFGKVYKLGYAKLSELLYLLFKGIDVVDALIGESASHSHTLQDYVLDVLPDEIEVDDASAAFSEDVEPPAKGVLLEQVFEAATVEIATSILTVAEKLHGVLDRLPSKYGDMAFQSMRTLNRQRGSLGTYAAQINHCRVAPRIVVFDVSGSVTPHTVQRIVGEVVALAYKANASLAIVSDTATYWDPGTFTVDDVLAAAEYGGTRYEQLLPLLHRDWETVVAVADYDSQGDVPSYIKRNARGSIGTLFDLSLVNRPTHLSACLGVLAHEVKPLLIGNSNYVLQ